MEDLRRFVPPSMRERVSHTVEGFLAECLDAALYNSDTKDGKFTTASELHLHPCSNAKVKRVLAAARDRLEAIAFREVWSGNTGTLTDAYKNEVTK